MRWILSFLFFGLLSAQSPRLLRVGHLLDVRAGAWRMDQALLLRADGRIEACRPWKPQDGTPDLDLSSRWVIPGLIDAHTHLFLQGSADAAAYEAQILKESVPYRTLRASAAARAALRQGFTTLRDLGTEGAGHADSDLKRAIEAKVVPGPRLQVADLAFSATGAYPVLSPAWELHLPSGVQVVDGVRIVHGSDAGAFPWDHPLTRELELMVAHGMSPLQALQAATIRAAEALGLEAELGSLEVGRRADFVVLLADPLANLRALHPVQQVYKDGQRQPE